MYRLYIIYQLCSKGHIYFVFEIRIPKTKSNRIYHYRTCLRAKWRDGGDTEAHATTLRKQLAAEERFE